MAFSFFSLFSALGPVFIQINKYPFSQEEQIVFLIVVFLLYQSKRASGFGFWSFFPTGNIFITGCKSPLAWSMNSVLSPNIPHHGWIRGGHLDAFTTGQGSYRRLDLFYLSFFCPFSYYYFLGFTKKKRGTRSNAQCSAETETEIPFGFSIPPLNPFLSFIRHREAISEDTPFVHHTAQGDFLTHSLFFLWFFFPFYE